MNENISLSIEIEIQCGATLSKGNMRKVIERVREELEGIEEKPQVKIIFK